MGFPVLKGKNYPSFVKCFKMGLIWGKSFYGTCGSLCEHVRWRQRQRSRPRLEMETKRGSDANMSASFNVCIKSFRHLKEAKQNRNDKLVFGNSESEEAVMGGYRENFYFSNHSPQGIHSLHCHLLTELQLTCLSFASFPCTSPPPYDRGLVEVFPFGNFI